MILWRKKKKRLRKKRRKKSVKINWMRVFLKPVKKIILKMLSCICLSMLLLQLKKKDGILYFGLLQMGMNK